MKLRTSIPFLWFFVLEMWSHYTAQASLKVMILLSQFHECWNVPPYPAHTPTLKEHSNWYSLDNHLKAVEIYALTHFQTVRSFRLKAGIQIWEIEAHISNCLGMKNVPVPGSVFL
jgi:hypothetical protein